MKPNLQTEIFMKDGIPYRNHSPYGWWIATYIIRSNWDDEPNPAQNTRCLAWENTIILQASDRETAYIKAVSRASMDCSEFEDNTRSNKKGRWVLEGFVSLLPIYDELEDGAEILWVEHKNRTIGKIRSWIKQKEELKVFDDTPSIGDKVPNNISE